MFSVQHSTSSGAYKRRVCTREQIIGMEPIDERSIKIHGGQDEDDWLGAQQEATQ